MGYKLRVRPNRDEELQAELDRIVDVLRARPDVEKVILFGSMARGEVGSSSDIDLMIVQNTDRSFLDRIDDVLRSVAPRKAVDVIVYTPEEFASLRESRGFVKQAISKGKVLYEKSR